jgi:hypothetical protein
MEQKLKNSISIGQHISQKAKAKQNVKSNFSLAAGGQQGR